LSRPAAGFRNRSARERVRMQRVQTMAFTDLPETWIVVC
jgi:hypothetical protein